MLFFLACYSGAGNLNDVSLAGGCSGYVALITFINVFYEVNYR